MTILGLNAIGTRHSGAATVLIGLIQYLLLQSEPDKIFVFASPTTERQFSFPQDERLQIVDCPNLTNNPILRFLWLQSVFRYWATRYHCDLIYNFNNFAGVMNIPQVTFIQQSLYFSTEAIETYRKSSVSLKKRLRFMGEPALMRAIYKRSLSLSTRAIVQTYAMKSELLNWFHLPEEKLIVIPPQMPQFSSPASQSETLEVMKDKRFYHWLYVGNNSPYKNIEVIYQTARMGLAENKNWRFHLVGIENIPGNLENIQAHGYLRDGELLESYSLAQALIMPSLVETVGLPMLEAMLTGVPIIAADRPYAREICGSAALYFNPNRAEELFDNLSCLEGDENRLSLINLGHERTKTFATNNYAFSVWRVLQSTLERS